MTAPLRRRRAAQEDGVYSLEILGLLPWAVMVAVLAFQLAAIGGAMSMAENAARTGSRSAGLGGDAIQASLDAVDPGVRDRTSVEQSDETVTVWITVPIVIPLIDLDVTTIERSATLPSTTSRAATL